MKRLFAISLSLLALAGLTACSDSSSPTDGDGNGTTPPASLTFQDFVGPLFAKKCTNGICHGSAPFKNGFSVLSYNSVLAGGFSSNGIVPNNLDSSVVYQRLTGRITPRMPFNLPPLPPTTLDSIAQWINAGAPNTP